MSRKCWINLLYSMIAFVVIPASAQWVQTSGPHAKGNIWAIATTGTDLFVGTDGDGIYRSTDSGGSWAPADSGLENLFISALAAVPTPSGRWHLIAGTSDGSFLSTDLGESWSRLVPRMDLPDPNCFAVNGSTVFAGTNSGIYRCDFDSSRWNVVSLLPSGVSIASLAAAGSKVLAGTWNSGVYASTNSGETWALANAGLRAASYGGVVSVTGLAIRDSMEFAATDSGLFRWEDNSGSWIESGAGIVESDVFCLAAAGKLIFAGTSNGVYLSTNGGTNWVRADSGLTIKNTISLIADQQYIYGGFYETAAPLNSTTASVWRRPLSEMSTGVYRNTSIPPTEIALDQNYPNPFNPSTNIRYTVEGSRRQASGFSDVRLVVYDVLGREAAVLVNERKAPGRYEVSFDGGRFPSGVYFYRLTSGSITATKSMVLVR